MELSILNNTLVHNCHPHLTSVFRGKDNTKFLMYLARAATLGSPEALELLAHDIVEGISDEFDVASVESMLKLVVEDPNETPERSTLARYVDEYSNVNPHSSSILSLFLLQVPSCDQTEIAVHIRKDRRHVLQSG